MIPQRPCAACYGTCRALHINLTKHIIRPEYEHTSWLNWNSFFAIHLRCVLVFFLFSPFVLEARVTYKAALMWATCTQVAKGRRVGLEFGCWERKLIAPLKMKFFTINIYIFSNFFFLFSNMSYLYSYYHCSFIKREHWFTIWLVQPEAQVHPTINTSLCKW